MMPANLRHLTMSWALLRQREELRQEHGAIRAEIQRVRRMIRFEDDFAGEAGEQRARLTSLDLLRIPGGGDVDGHVCPLCDSRLETSVTSVVRIRESMERVAREISDVGEDLPRLQRVLSDYENSLTQIRLRLDENQDAIDGVTSSLQIYDELRELSLRRAAVRGRISLYLESVNKDVESGFLGERIADLIEQIAQLERDLDSDAAADRLSSALSIISHSMTRYATSLKLEHAPAPVRLDIRRLTVIVDSLNGSFRLNQIGSGENWVGYHLAALFGLNEFFIQNARPVPRFMVLDQPSQVYFPPDAPAGEESLTDDDRAGITRIYRELIEFQRNVGVGYQIIVLDHADLQEDWFQEAVIQRWRGQGEGLIPAAWIN